MTVGDNERKTQNKVVKFFRNPKGLDYRYLGNLSKALNGNIREDLLAQYLKRKEYSEVLVDEAIRQMKKAAGDMSDDLYSANKAVYELLKYGAKVKTAPNKAPQNVYFIDEAHPANNEFAIAEEVTVIENSEKRPDLVIYLNLNYSYFLQIK